jgi:hypothetical protein
MVIVFPETTKGTCSVVFSEIGKYKFQLPAHSKGASEGGWVGAGVGVTAMVGVGAEVTGWVTRVLDSGVSEGLPMLPPAPVPTQAMITSKGTSSSTGGILRNVIACLHLADLL